MLPRLNCIQGEIKGLQTMIGKERYYLEILQPISSVHKALRGLGKVIMRNYLEISATEAIQSKRKEREERIYNELMDVIYKFAK